MAPFDPSTWGRAAEPAVHVIIGILFGFVLERAGFGSAKKLSSQFYLHDLSVLKVMFTGIITAMMLTFAGVAVGLVDFAGIWVNPTYLGSGVLGGMLFGIGFLVGGYCPGTAIVAAATLKLDALFFIGGLLAGITVFGFTLPWFNGFWSFSGAKGELTLFEWLGISPGLAVAAAVFMALGMFVGGEALERWMKKRAAAEVSP